MVVALVVVVVVVVVVMTHFAQSGPSEPRQQISLGVIEQVDWSVLHTPGFGFVDAGPW